MASVGKDPNGHRRVLFVACDRSRRTVRLGKCSERNAEHVARHVEELLSAQINSQPIRRETAVWLGQIDDKLHDRLARVGLVAVRDMPGSAKLGQSLNDYLDSRVDVKSATKVVYGQVIRDLKNHFGDDRDLRKITPGQADHFRQWLIARKLAPTTVYKRTKVARALFHAMRRRRVIEENPFEGVKLSLASAKDRQRFITRDETIRLLEACPNHHWKAIVSLARYGGLRCPSEVLSVRWQDVNWETGRVTVRSPKTEHHGEEKSSRVIPLFPELRLTLMESFEAAPEGAEYVVDERFRKAAMGPGGWQNANLRTTFGRIIRRAGLTPWPRLFHNLRASRETELVESFPVQVVTSWLDNTPSIAMRHYLMTTDADFQAAIKDDEGDKKAAQNPAQHVQAIGRNVSQNEKPEIEETAFCDDLQVVATQCDTENPVGLEPARLELATFLHAIQRKWIVEKLGNTVIHVIHGTLSFRSDLQAGLYRRDFQCEFSVFGSQRR